MKPIRKAQKNSSIDKAVRRALFRVAEKKVYSTQAANTTIASTGTVINLSNGIVEGDDINMRSGTTLTVTKQTLRFNFQASVATQSARVILFRDMMNTGTTPSISEVLPTSGYLSHYSDVREIQQRRYQILWDTVFDCSLTGNTTTTKLKVVNRPCRVMYNGTTAVAASNGKGAIFLLVIGSASTGDFDYDWQAVYNDS
jgi:hypothetical protein